MRDFLRSVVRAFASNDLLWQIVCVFGAANSRRLAYARAMVVRHRVVRALGTPARVPSGPFAGMIFPDLKDRGGGWLPRLLGTYESELSDAVERVIASEPERVIDIGCAEGYYAVGFALRLPRTYVDAYDIVEAERLLCDAMARANGVEERVLLKQRCDEQILLRTDPMKHCLVLADCEGAERDLITTNVAHHLRKSWFLIECHDLVIPGMTDLMLSRLAQTHKCTVIQSTSDTQKARSSRANAIADQECLSVREFIYGEGRNCLMNWIVASPQP
jgi:SAM-dependent methyltransferase